MVKIAVFVSGGGTNLRALIDAAKEKHINGEIELVVSNRMNAYGLARARLAGIDAVCLKDEDLIIEKKKKREVDLIVLAGYLAIVSDKLVKLYENKIINIHPSLIPTFCGPGYYGIHVHNAAFKRGVKVAGATVHFVSSEVDGGPIILQEAIDVSDCDSAESMQEKILLNVEHKILVKAVKLYCENKVVVEDERVKILWKER